MNNYYNECSDLETENRLAHLSLAKLLIDDIPLQSPCSDPKASPKCPGRHRSHRSPPVLYRHFKHAPVNLETQEFYLISKGSTYLWNMKTNKDRETDYQKQKKKIIGALDSAVQTIFIF